MIIALSGNNSYLLKKQLKKLSGDFMVANGDLAIERFDGEELELNQLIDAVQAVPFLANKKMVVVRSLGANKILSEQAEKVFDLVASSTELILYEPSIDKRTLYYKTLQKRTDIELKEFNDLDQASLARWLTEEAKQQNANLGYGDAVYLVERVGQNQMMLSSELNKLITYKPQITRQSIDLLTEPTPQSKIFDLLDSAFAGNRKKAVELYQDQRTQRVEPQQILAMLAWQLHILALVKTGAGKSSAVIAKDAGLNPYVVDKSMRLGQNITLARIKELVSELLRIDVKGKTLNYNLDQALQTYIISI